MLAQFGVVDAGLGLDVAVGHIDVEHLAHAFEAENERPIDGIGASGQPGSCAPGHDGHSVVVAGTHDGADLLDCAREDNGKGLTRLGAHRPVKAIGLEDVGVGNDVAL